MECVNGGHREPVSCRLSVGTVLFRTHLCLVIVYTLLFAVVGVRRKLQTSANGEVCRHHQSLVRLWTKHVDTHTCKALS
jgi:hypothetical protein